MPTCPSPHPGGKWLPASGGRQRARLEAEMQGAELRLGPWGKRPVQNIALGQASACSLIFLCQCCRTAHRRPRGDLQRA